MSKLDQAESKNTLPSKIDLQKGFENLSPDRIKQMNWDLGKLHVAEEAVKPWRLKVATGKISRIGTDWKPIPPSLDFYEATKALWVRW